MNIRIISPASAIDPQYIDGALSVLQSWGHKVTVAPHAKSSYGRFAASPEHRLQDLNDAFADPGTDAILCSRGGYGLAQIIDRVVPAQGKLLIGFSDVTCLHCLCATHNMPSLHSIMAKHIATLPSNSEPLRALRSILDGGDIRYCFPAGEGSRVGETEAVLRGGNLSVFYGLQRTPYQVTDRNSILFVEDIGERHYHIDRMMQNMRMSGVMHNIQGYIIGQFADCPDDESMSCTLQQTLLHAADNTRYPIAAGFPAGHVEYNMPLFLNLQTHLKVTEDKIILTQTNPFR